MESQDLTSKLAYGAADLDEEDQLENFSVLSQSPALTKKLTTRFQETEEENSEVVLFNCQNKLQRPQIASQSSSAASNLVLIP